MAHVLIIEDNDTMRSFMATLLQEAGHSCRQAEHGARGWRCLHEERFDVAIIDLDMPVIDGWQLIRRMRQQTGLRSLPAIAITGLAFGGLDERLREAGFDAWFINPFPVTQFLHAVTILAEDRRPVPPLVPVPHIALTGGSRRRPRRSTRLSASRSHQSEEEPAAGGSGKAPCPS